MRHHRLVMRRLTMRANDKAVDFPDSKDGMEMIKKFRKEHPEFKRRKIRNVLQMKPSEVPLGKVYDINYV